MTEISTKEQITWCPGCTNFLIKKAVEDALKELIAEGYKPEEFAMVADIGCAGKIYDYINVSSINALHGRTLPTMTGIKIGNPKMNVLGFAGDGGTFDEGLDHFIHSCRYNNDMNFIVHNNQVFALTVGQATALTESGYTEKTHTFGFKELPLNPIVLALESGASFVARANSLDPAATKEIIKAGIKHKGFSFIEIIQPCITFHDFREDLRKNAYPISPMNKDDAIKEAKKWDYSHGKKIPIGIFYQEDRPTFEENYNLTDKNK